MPKIDVMEKMSGAISSTKSASAADQRIAQLLTEIRQLKEEKQPLEKELETLREQLSQESGEHHVSVDFIDPYTDQPRQTITPSIIQAKARSLSREGQNTPIILVPKDDSRYILWDGEVRWQAAKLLGWETIRAVFAPMPENLHHKALITFLQSQDLNQLDRAEAVVREIKGQTGLPDEKIPSVLRSLSMRLRRQNLSEWVTGILNDPYEKQLKAIQTLKQNLAKMPFSEEQEQVLSVLLDLQIPPISFAANDLRMLSLDPQIKDVVRSGLSCSHALTLQKLASHKNHKLLKDAISKVLNQQLNVKETKNIVSSLLQEDEEPKSTPDHKSVTRISSLNLKSYPREELIEIQKALQIKLKEIKALLRNTTQE